MLPENIQKINEIGIYSLKGALLYLGKLCPRNHNYLDSGFSLRYSHKRKSCVLCAAENKQKPEYKERNKKRQSEYQKENRSARNAYQREYYKNNTDKCKAMHKKSRDKRKDAQKEHCKIYRQINKDKCRSYKNLWRSLNSEHFKQKCRESYHRNKDKRKSYRDAYRQTEQGKFAMRRALKRRQLRIKDNYEPYTLNDLNQHLALFKNQCAYCGIDLKLERRGFDYHSDHFVPIAKGGVDGIRNLVLSCPFCNMSKHDHDPHEWYSKQPFYSEDRWQHILNVLGDKSEILMG